MGYDKCITKTLKNDIIDKAFKSIKPMYED